MATTMFDLTGKVAVVTGGGGVLCGALCLALAEAGAKVVPMGRRLEPLERVAGQIRAAGGEALAVTGDVLNRAELEKARESIHAAFGPVDILVNGAGGNRKEASTNPGQSFFDLPVEALDDVMRLNWTGTVLPCQVFGRDMAEKGEGVILNIASMSGIRPLTRIPAYSAAKSAVSNFTQWLAVHIAQEYSPNIRVNAIAPGFFLTEQNRFLLTDEHTGALTARGESIIRHTPMGRFGAPEDLIGATLWLVSPAARFVTGVVTPVDGGFAAFAGV